MTILKFSDIQEFGIIKISVYKVKGICKMSLDYSIGILGNVATFFGGMFLVWGLKANKGDLRELQNRTDKIDNKLFTVEDNINKLLFKLSEDIGEIKGIVLKKIIN
jgi:tetrahydromethanopterin S-methyltransferase subunit G